MLIIRWWAEGTVSMSVVVRIGLVELALGAVLGWAVVVSVSRPDLLRRIGVVAPRRVLQAHLDYIVMGLILVAVGLAVPDLPAVVAVALVIGTWVNPTLFLPMAFSERAVATRAFQAVSALSFVATSGSLVTVAVVA